MFLVTFSKTSVSAAVVKSCDKKWSKQQACLFCGKLIIKLPRHYESCHENESEVEKLLSLPKNSNERKELLCELRNKGNFKHNSNAWYSPDSELIVKRRPKLEKNSKDYLPCRKCLALISKRLLFKHTAKCTGSYDTRKRTKWERVQGLSSLLLPMNKYASTFLKQNVLAKMMQDEITQIVKKDKLLLLFGNYLCTKLGYEKHLANLVSTKMRELARLYLTIKKVNPNIKEFSRLFRACYFDLMVKGVQNLCGFDSNTGKFLIPTLATKLGQSIKKCAFILRCQLIRSESDNLLKIIDNFLILFDLEWGVTITKHALTTLYQAKWNNPDMLPFAEDVKKLNEHISDKLNKLEIKLKNRFEYDDWNEFGKLLLAHIIVFNRRRVGDVHRFTIDTFNKRTVLNSESDIYKSLTTTEKLLAKKYFHVDMRGKRGRKVPVLLSLETTNRIKMMLKLRKFAHVSKQNPYVFGRLKSSYIRGSTVLRHIAGSCGATNPRTLTSTRLRKHIATSSQILNLKENELDCIADYMGHSIKVHREFYRLPNTAVHLAKMSKLLIALDNGDISKYKGKSLEELDINHRINENVILDDSENTVEDIENRENKKNYYLSESDSDSEKVISKRSKKYCVSHKRPWSSPEKLAVKKHLNHFIESYSLPGKKDCESVLKVEPILKDRSWLHVKCFVRNRIETKKRNDAKIF